MAHLVCFKHGNKGGSFDLGQGALHIGRNPDSDVVLPETAVSWTHAKVYSRNESWIVADLDSTNGTTVNGEKCKEQMLREGDVIKLGDHALVFHGDNEEHEGRYLASEQTLIIDKAKRDLLRQDKSFTGRLTSKGWDEMEGESLPERIGYWLFEVFSMLGKAIAGLFPSVQWIRDYQAQYFRHDLAAGVTVAVMLVPQGMAYALLAGLPPITGLYAALLPPLIYAITGTSRQLSVGPVALDSLLVATGVGAIAQSGSSEYLGLCILLALMVGAMQVLMGVLRLGFVVNFLSSPVITGFSAAAAIIIAVTQILPLFGISAASGSSFLQRFTDLPAQLAGAHQLTAIIGIVCLLVLLALKQWASKLPGPLLVISAAIVGAWYFGWDAMGVTVIGVVPAGLPQFSIPEIDMQLLGRLLPTAIMLALIGFMETISIGKRLGNLHHYRVRPNQELIATGLGNLGGGFSGAFPVAGGFARSAVNDQAGARTQLSSIIAAFLIALTLLFLTPVFYYLPIAVLAAIVLMAVVGLVDIKQMRYLVKVKRSEGVLLLITLLATLGLGIPVGLATGVVFSIFLFISLNTRPHTAILGRLPGTNIFRSQERYPEADGIPGAVVLRIDASFYFANAEFLQDRLEKVLADEGPALKAVILDASAINDLDSSADTALKEIVRELRKQGIEFFLAGVKAPVREVMQRSGFYNLVGGDHYFYTIDAAIKRYLLKAEIGPANG